MIQKYSTAQLTRQTKERATGFLEKKAKNEVLYDFRCPESAFPVLYRDCAPTSSYPVNLVVQCSALALA